MLIRSPKNAMKASLVAVTAIAALGMSACGSGDEGDSSSSSSTAATSASATTSAATSSAAASSSAASESTTESAAEDTQAADDAAAAAAAAQQALANATPQAPVDNGSPASAADAQAITDLVMGINQATTLRSYLSYLPDHLCDSQIEANGGRQAFDVSQIEDVPLTSIPGLESGAHVDSVSDIMVSGNTASASVTGTAGGNTTTETQRFLNEGGTWKFCS
ncbi:hypothetical protein [Corynebacterium vitaeruminis]|nr:hypothetical protein [Corynebacterium vitaeruminis]